MLRDLKTTPQVPEAVSSEPVRDCHSSTAHVGSPLSLAVDSTECSVLSQPNVDCCLESFWKYMLRDSTQKFIKNGGQDDGLQIQRIYLGLYNLSRQQN